MRLPRPAYLLASVSILALAAPLYAVDPNPLESAYWRFEEGTANSKVAEGNNTVLDSINANHMRRFTNTDPAFPPDVNAPTYVADVPGAVVPATGQANTLSLWFSGSFQDIYSDTKHINNPIATAFTLEASFKPAVAGTGLWQAIVSKESTSGDTTSDSPPLCLKVTGDGFNRVRLELRDRGNNLRVVDSLATIVPGRWYHAAVVATASQVDLYLDENTGDGYVLQGSAPIAGGGPLYQGTADDYDTVWNIGKGMWARQIADFFHGAIDEVRLTNEALDPADFLWVSAGMPGDFNRDRRVDIDDWLIFHACAAGAAVPYQPLALPTGCSLTPDDEGIIAADFDGDGDVDQTDFAVFQRCYGQDDRPAAANCAD